MLEQQNTRAGSLQRGASVLLIVKSGTHARYFEESILNEATTCRRDSLIFDCTRNCPTRLLLDDIELAPTWHLFVLLGRVLWLLIIEMVELQARSTNRGEQ